MNRPKIQKNKIFEEKWINLSSNEPAFGDSKRYPYTWSLYDKLSKYLNISEEKILLTFGSEQGIRFAFDTFVPQNGNVSRPDPTFGMLEVFEYYRDANVYKIKYNELKIEVNDIIDILKNNKIHLFYLANPDNPTGAFINKESLISIIKTAQDNKTFVVLDEAYFGYNTIDTNELIDEFDNLIIVRSFSKAYGLAGERVGYILSNKENISKLSVMRPMNEITQRAVNLAIKSLNNKTFKKNINQTCKWKKLFKEKFPKNYVDSYCNFILLATDKVDLVKHNFDINKIAIKTFNNKYIRIGIGTNKEMRLVLRVLNKLIGKQL